MEKYKLFALSQSQVLGKAIADNIGIELGKIKLDKFSDGELSPSFEESVRGYDVFIIGSLHQPHDNIMEMLLTIDSAKRAGANKVHVITPYYGYARQDRKDKSRGAIGARVLSNALKANGMDSIMIVDLHAGQIEGFFDNTSPVIHISGKDVFIPKLKTIVDKDWVICSPDAGGTTRAKKFSDILELPLIVINKRRDKPNSIGSMELVGDVTNKKVLIIDDMIDTAGSIQKAVELLLNNGAIEVSACITHGVLSGLAYKRIEESNLTKLYISDTIPVKDINKDGVFIPNKIETISCASVLATVIIAINSKISIETELNNIIYE
jgi:ribose-phosphate pyrophosphokinase